MRFPKQKRIRDRRTRQKVRRPYCEYCGAWETTANLEVHHIYSQGGSGPGDIEENLITLCAFPNDCHGKAQRYEISRDKLFELVALRMDKTFDEVKNTVLKKRRV